MFYGQERFYFLGKNTQCYLRHKNITAYQHVNITVKCSGSEQLTINEGKINSGFYQGILQHGVRMAACQLNLSRSWVMLWMNECRKLWISNMFYCHCIWMKQKHSLEKNRETEKKKKVRVSEIWHVEQKSVLCVHLLLAWQSAPSFQNVQCSWRCVLPRRQHLGTCGWRLLSHNPCKQKGGRQVILQARLQNGDWYHQQAAVIAFTCITSQRDRWTSQFSLSTPSESM